ncbi:MAG: BLUF domain-containing protein [Betaproteobacteria bacterium]
MTLIHLIYVSRASIECDDAELDTMLESSVRHNATQHVTGMLLYSGGNFMQVLEGEDTAVDETYGRIAKDHRHKGLIVVVREPIKKRDFESWSMGFRRLNQTDAAAHPNLAAFFEYGFDAERMGDHPRVATELLMRFGPGQH